MRISRAVATPLLLIPVLAYSSAWSAFAPSPLLRRGGSGLPPSCSSRRGPARRLGALGGLGMGKQPVLEKDKDGEWVLRLETELSGAWYIPLLI